MVQSLISLQCIFFHPLRSLSSCLMLNYFPHIHKTYNVSKQKIKQNEEGDDWRLRRSKEDLNWLKHSKFCDFSNFKIF